MEFLAVLAVLSLVVLFVSWPLWRGRAARVSTTPDEVAELEAARDAKYREIREAELDHQVGKLSAEDFAAVDHALRAEAIEILRALDQARGQANGHRGHERLPSR
jgi:hypothetical protein